MVHSRLSGLEYSYCLCLAHCRKKINENFMKFIIIAFIEGKESTSQSELLVEEIN